MKLCDFVVFLLYEREEKRFISNFIKIIIAIVATSEEDAKKTPHQINNRH